MRISIAMCTYNGAQFLQQQLDTFASQTHPPFELIVCDDGSTDATLALIESFARKVTFPVRIFKNQRNLGSTRNFEKAIGICDGDLIALSDQDDEWYPDKLARMLRLFEELPEASAAFSNADIIDDDSAFAGRKLWRSIGVDFSPGERVPYVYTGIVSSLLKLDYIATGATMVFRSKLRDQFIPIPGAWPHDAWIALCDMGWQHFQRRRFAIVSMHGSRLEWPRRRWSINWRLPRRMLSFFVSLPAGCRTSSYIWSSIGTTNNWQSLSLILTRRFSISKAGHL